MFGEFDAADLRAKLGGLEPVRGKSDAGCRGTLEISGAQNFDGQVEALCFRVAPKSKDLEPVVLQRFEGTLYGRVGGGASEIPVLLPWTVKQAKGARVEVLEASAWSGGPATEECPVEVGRLNSKTEFDEGRGRSLPRTTVALSNTAEHDVDVVLLAEYLEPERTESLVHARLPGGGELELVVSELATGAWEIPGAKLRRVSIADWSMVVDRGSERGRELLQAALDASYSVPTEGLPVGCAFTLEYHSAELDSLREGRLRLEADGEIELELDGDWPQATFNSTLHSLGEGLWCIAPKPLPEDVDVQLMRAGPRPIVRVAPNFMGFGNSGSVSLVLEDGHIARLASDALASDYGDGLHEVWLGVEGARWRLTRRARQVVSQRPEALDTVEVDWLGQGEAWMPARVVWTDSDWAGTGSRLVLSFGEWVTNPPELAEREPPSGALADELAAAWDGFYRYPESEVRVVGTYRARNAGNDGLWGGVRDVKGEFDLAAFRGGFWRDAAVDFAGKKRGDEQREVLENAVLDRVLMWSGRDLCRAAPFAEAFAGARLERDGAWIVATGAAVQAVRIADGRLAAVRDARGVEVGYDWAEVQGFLVPTERRAGGERVVVDWERVAPGWMWPERVEFIDVFTDGEYRWGPESLEFGKVSVEALGEAGGE